MGFRKHPRFRHALPPTIGAEEELLLFAPEPNSPHGYVFENANSTLAKSLIKAICDGATLKSAPAAHPDMSSLEHKTGICYTPQELAAQLGHNRMLMYNHIAHSGSGLLPAIVGSATTRDDNNGLHFHAGFQPNTPYADPASSSWIKLLLAVKPVAPIMRALSFSSGFKGKISRLQGQLSWHAWRHNGGIAHALKKNTLEVKDADATPNLDDIAAIATLYQCAVWYAALYEKPVLDIDTATAHHNEIQFQRYGSKAVLAGENDIELSPTEMLTIVIDKLRPLAREIGAEAELEHCLHIFTRGTSLATQQALYRELVAQGASDAEISRRLLEFVFTESLAGTLNSKYIPTKAKTKDTGIETP